MSPEITPLAFDCGLGVGESSGGVSHWTERVKGEGSLDTIKIIYLNRASDSGGTSFQKYMPRYQNNFSHCA